MTAPVPKLAPGPARPDTRARRLERAAKRRLAATLGRWVPARPVTPAEIVAGPVRHLLVVRQHNQMGDLVCALPALRALRRAFAAAQLTFLAGPLGEELLRSHPDVDRLLVFRKRAMRRPWKLAAFVRELRRPRPDLALVLTTVSFSTTSALLAKASGARWCAGVTSRAHGSNLSRALYNLELDPGPDGVHEVEHNLAPLRALVPAPYEAPRLEPQAAAAAAAGLFVQRHLPGTGPLVVVHAGAGKLANIWPAQHFAAVLQTLRRERGARLVLVEGPLDAGAAGALHAQLEGAAARWREPLDTTLGLLARADLVLANDSGIAHVAGAVGVPTVVVFGPTDVGRWTPPGEHVRAVVSTTGYVADVAPDAVLHAAMSALDARAAQPLRGPA